MKDWVKNKLNKDTFRFGGISAFVMIVFALQLIFILCLNIFCSKNWVDHDASMMYSHTIEMWKQKRLVLPAYAEETFLHLDTACIPAVLFYGLTKDIFVSYGISNVIFIALFILVIFDVMSKITSNKTYWCLAALLFLIPYRIGMLQYFNMLFYEVSFYNYCVLVPLMAIDLFLYQSEKRSSWKYYILLVIYLLLIAISAFSRGTYLLFVGIAPVLLCYVLEIILDKEGLKAIRKDKVALILFTLGAYALGIIISAMMGVASAASSYNLVKTKDIVDNFLKVIWGYFSIFIRPDASSDVISLEGIKYLISFGFALFIAIIIIFNIKYAFKDAKYSNELRYFTVIIIFNAMVLGLTKCAESEIAFPERYLFPGFVPVLISVPIALIYMERIERKLLRNALYLCITILIAGMMLIADYGIIEAFKENKQETEGMKQAIEYARNNDINTIIFMNDDNGAFISRSLAPDLKTVALDFKEDGTYVLKNREYYYVARDRGYFDNRNLLVVPWNTDIYSFMPEYLVSSYTWAADVEDYYLYVSDANKFDDYVGFPLNDNVLYETIDFANSEGYQYLGDIDAYGYLETTGTGDYVLLSPFLEAPYTSCDVILNYEMGHKTSDGNQDETKGECIGQLEILDAGLNAIGSADIRDDSNYAIVTIDRLESCYVAVKLYEGIECTIHDVHFKVIDDLQ